MIQYNAIQHNTIQYNTIKCNAIQCNTIQYNTMQHNTFLFNTLYTFDSMFECWWIEPLKWKYPVTSDLEPLCALALNWK